MRRTLLTIRIVLAAGFLAAALPTLAGATSFPSEPSYGEPNDTPATAYGPIGADMNYSSYTGGGGDVDWFYFETTGAQDATITLTNGGEGIDESCQTLAATVTDAAGNVIDSKRLQGFGATDTVTVSAAGPARYYVEFAAADGCSATYEYTLRVSSTAPLAGPPAPNMLGTTPPCLAAKKALATHTRALARLWHELGGARSARARGRLRVKIASERARVMQDLHTRENRCQP